MKQALFFYALGSLSARTINPTQSEDTSLKKHCKNYCVSYS